MNRAVLIRRTGELMFSHTKTGARTSSGSRAPNMPTSFIRKSYTRRIFDGEFIHVHCDGRDTRESLLNRSQGKGVTNNSSCQSPFTRASASMHQRHTYPNSLLQLRSGIESAHGWVGQRYIAHKAIAANNSGQIGASGLSAHNFCNFSRSAEISIFAQAQ